MAQDTWRQEKSDYRQSFKKSPKRTDMKRIWMGPECKIGIKDPGTRWQLRLKIERTSDGFNRKTFGLEFMK
jgi:hypothetical protein